MDIQPLISMSVFRTGIDIPLWSGFFTDVPNKKLLLQAIPQSYNDFAIALVEQWDGSWGTQENSTLPIRFVDVELGTITLTRLVGRLHTIKGTSPPRILLEEQGAIIVAAWTPYRPGDDIGHGATVAEAIGALVVRDKFVEVENTSLLGSRWSVHKSKFVG